MKTFVHLMLKTLLLLLLLLTAASLWIHLQLTQHQFAWSPSSYIHSTDWSDYRYSDGEPESACNCSAILQGDDKEVEKAQLLSLRGSFQKQVRVPDEFYISATRDCRCDCSSVPRRIVIGLTAACPAGRSRRPCEPTISEAAPE